ncbi:MAG: DUF5654 family protein [archaeon]
MPFGASHKLLFPHNYGMKGERKGIAEARNDFTPNKGAKGREIFNAPEEKANEKLNEFKETTAAIRKGTRELRREVKRNMTIAITGAFAFVIALFWKDLITEWINSLLIFFRLTGDSFFFKLLAALFVTLICVLAIVYFSRWAEKPAVPK